MAGLKKRASEGEEFCDESRAVRGSSATWWSAFAVIGRDPSDSTSKLLPTGGIGPSTLGCSGSLEGALRFTARNFGLVRTDSASQSGHQAHAHVHENPEENSAEKGTQDWVAVVEQDGQIEQPSDDSHDCAGSLGWQRHPSADLWCGPLLRSAVLRRWRRGGLAWWVNFQRGLLHLGLVFSSCHVFQYDRASCGDAQGVKRRFHSLSRASTNLHPAIAGIRLR